MSKKSPGFTYYPKDFIADTAMLSTTEAGAYWLLCTYAWVGLPGYEQGYLPDDDGKLAMLTRQSLKDWAAMRANVLALFKQAPTGQLFHKRLLEELAKQEARSESARGSVKQRWKGGHGRNESPTKALPTPDGSDTAAVRSAYESDTNVSGSYEIRTPRADALKADADANANEAVEKSEVGHVSTAWPPPPDPDEAAIGADFDTFWEAYPAPLNQPDAERAWLETAPERPPLPDLLAALKALAASARWRAEGGRAIPAPGKWLRRRGWTERPPARGDGFSAQADLSEPSEVELRLAAEGHPAYSHLRHLLPAGAAS